MEARGWGGESDLRPKPHLPPRETLRGGLTGAARARATAPRALVARDG